MEFKNEKSFKKTPRFGNLKHAKKFLPNMWIVKDEEGNIIACCHAQVVENVVKIGPIAVKESYQV
jgi:hypothetical protein